MVYPLGGLGGDAGSPSGYTYAAVVVRLDGTPSGGPCTRNDVLAALREVRFTGWLGQPEGGWLVAVAASGDGTVAAGRRGVVGVDEWLADRLATTVLAIRVVADRQLLVALWADREEIGRYVSDPSYGLDPDDDTLPTRSASSTPPPSPPRVAAQRPPKISPNSSPRNSIRKASSNPSGSRACCACSGCRPGWWQRRRCRAASRRAPERLT